MMIKYALAEHAKKKGEETKQKITAYFSSKPYAHHHECARDLGISRWTVYRHLKLMRDSDGQTSNY